ncbi:MAG: OmpH family outer membrane protein [Deltaproteobacteria bacterium]|jgi:outer membrane protein|nr:OmpH family outer membrane protein [Deltaproteobacteria bacterium]MBT7892461.1 OmpH family outer membrane protein [Deltaproteobacteria bacterium]
MKKIILVTIFILLATTVFGQVVMKVGYVNMNKAINLSNEGKRSKKFLEVQAQRTQGLLKAKEQDLLKKEAELKNSIMLNETAKNIKRQEIVRLKKELRDDLGKAKKSMRQDEMRHSTKIFKDLVLVIKEIAKEENFDLILEFNVKQTILFSKYEMIDITDKATERYNKIQSIE